LNGSSTLDYIGTNKNLTKRDNNKGELPKEKQGKEKGNVRL
jgi:hypothetical protein